MEPAAKDQVLSTLNVDGSRRRLRPKLSQGAMWRRRRVFAWILLLIFTVTPYIEVGGRPLMLFDLVARRFTIFGVVFLPSDTLLLSLLLLLIIVAIFLLTALFGRVWCGWACPQTVYMEFLFRPIERLFEGSAAKQRSIDKGGLSPRRIAKNVVFLIVSVFVGHTFLAYFVGVKQLIQWMQGSPLQHPIAFLVMGGVSAAMFLDFAWFREQTCLIVCPYGRLQSVLLDKQSLIVGYDYNRGEPRGKLKADTSGDCIDCNACVATCPTGIDIRKGLQMECIHCTQCIDACDAIMTKVNKPTGLIRYTSQGTLEKQPRRLMRPRVVIYPAILIAVLGLFGFTLLRTTAAEVQVLRGLSSPYTVSTDQVTNHLRLKIVNRASKTRQFKFSLVDASGLQLIAPQNPITVGGRKHNIAPFFVRAPKSVFTAGRHPIKIRVTGGGFDKQFEYVLLGPFGTKKP